MVFGSWIELAWHYIKFEWIFLMLSLRLPLQRCIGDYPCRISMKNILFNFMSWPKRSCRGDLNGGGAAQLLHCFRVAPTCIWECIKHVATECRAAFPFTTITVSNFRVNWCEYLKLSGQYLSSLSRALQCRYYSITANDNLPIVDWATKVIFVN